MAGEIQQEKKKIEKIEDGIAALETEYGSRAFSYDSESDAGYQNYLKLMQDNGKKAMEDTVGKASALTGGYANSYAASAGQQVYNDFMKQGAEAQASFRQLARDEFDAENQRILNQLSLLKEQKKSIWDDAALKAGFGDYSGYVNDLGLYESEDAAKLAIEGPVKPSAPTAEQISKAKELYKNQGQAAYNAYIQGLGFTDDVMWDAISGADGFEDFLKEKNVLASNFSLAGDGGWNWGWGLDNDASFTLNRGSTDPSHPEETHTVKEWVEQYHNQLGMSEDEAKEFFKQLQKDLGAA